MERVREPQEVEGETLSEAVSPEGAFSAGPGPSGAVRVPHEKMSSEQLLHECKRLAEDNMLLKQQLQRKEEQRLTAIRLLKQAKKRHEEHKLGEEMKKNLSGKEKGFEGGTPGSYAGSNLSFAPPPSIMGSVMSLGRRSISGSYRKSTGLKELIEPDVRLAQVLQKLGSEPVLGTLERIVDRIGQE